MLEKHSRSPPPRRNGGRTAGAGTERSRALRHRVLQSLLSRSTASGLAVIPAESSQVGGTRRGESCGAKSSLPKRSQDDGARRGEPGTLGIGELMSHVKYTDSLLETLQKAICEPTGEEDKLMQKSLDYFFLLTRPGRLHPREWRPKSWAFQEEHWADANGWWPLQHIGDAKPGWRR